MQFKILVTLDREKGTVRARYPPLPGCHAEAPTREEAVEQLKEAIVEAVGIFNKWVRESEDRDETMLIDL